MPKNLLKRHEWQYLRSFEKDKGEAVVFPQGYMISRKEKKVSVCRSDARIKFIVEPDEIQSYRYDKKIIWNDKEENFSRKLFTEFGPFS